MHFGDWSDFDISIRETNDGYAINIKGDKQKLKPKLEAIEAYVNFRRKARVAGVGEGVHAHYHGSHHKHRTLPGKLLHKLHRHFGAAHHVIGNIHRYGMGHGQTMETTDHQPVYQAQAGMGRGHGRRRGFRQQGSEVSQHGCGCGK